MKQFLRSRTSEASASPSPTIPPLRIPHGSRFKFLALLLGVASLSCADSPNLGVPEQEPLDSIEAEYLDEAGMASHGGRTVRRVSGNAQTGAAGRPLPEALVAEIVDDAGRPLSGVLVNWIAKTGNGEVSDEWVRTDSKGRVETRFTLGSDRPKQRAIARIEGARISYVAWATGEGGGGGSPGSVAVAPDPMRLSVGESESFAATVYDAKGKPTSGGKLRWRSSDKDVAAVNSSGTVTAKALGQTTITASAGNKRGRATLQVVASDGSDISIRRVSGNSQSGTVGQPVAEPLRVQVRNGSGKGISEQRVNWTVILGTGSVSEGSTRTNDSGHTEVTFTLGNEVGAQKVRAEAQGKRVTFSLTGESDGGEQIEKIGGDGQSGPPSSELDVPLRVVVKDGAGAVIKDANVNWSVIEGGGAVSQSSTTTGDAGETQVNFTLGAAPGRNRARATLASGDRVTFTATAEGDGGSSTVESVTVDPASFTLNGTGATRQLGATGVDGQGNAVAGTTFSWSSGNEGVATVNGDGVVTARGEGQADIVATADCCGGVSGSARATVEVDGPPPPSGDGFANLPGGWRVVNDNPWDKIPRWWQDDRPWPGSEGGFPNGWGKIISAGPNGGPVGEGAVVQLSDAPDGDPNVFRITYNPGHLGGEDAYGVYYPMDDNSSSSVYFAIWMRFGEAGDRGSFKRHGNGMKMFSFDGAGDRVNMGWSDLDFEQGGGPCPDAFSMAFPGGGEDDWTSAFPDYTGRFPTCLPSFGHHQFGMYGHPDSGNHPSVKIIVGEWALLELLIEDGPGRVRWWWNGTKAADFTGGSITAGPFRELLIDGTWGGGNSTVPAPQHWYIARTLVAVPR